MRRISTPRSEAAGGEPAARLPRLRAALRPIAVMAVCLTAVFALLVVGEYLQRLSAYRIGRRASGQDAPSVAGPLEDMIRNTYHRLPRPVDEPRLARSGLPIYELRIRPRNLERLRDTAEAVTAAEIATGIPREYLPARFRLGDRWIDIEVKARGLYEYHYAPERMSLRLKFPKSHYFRGKRQINISNVYDKGLTIDVTTNWELARHDILTWDSRFVLLVINDAIVGVFQETEQFGQSITDRANRAEGFVFGGKDRWEEVPYQVFGREEGLGWEKAKRAVERFWTCRDHIDNDPREGPCDWEFASSYLDTEKFARVAALATLLGSEHAWSNGNIRLYYDPARGTLEPIPWDYILWKIDLEESPGGETAIFQGRALLRIPEFRRLRDRYLWTLIHERVEPMIEHANRLFADLEAPLRWDNQNLDPWDEARHRSLYENRLRVNADTLRGLFDSTDLRANAWQSDGRLVVELENRGKAAVVIAGVRLGDGSDPRLTTFGEPLVVEGAWSGRPGRGRLELDASAGVRLVGLAARNEVTGEELAPNAIRVAHGEPASDATPAPPRSPAPPALELPANTRLADGTIVFGPGTVEIESTWEIPSTYPVEFRPGLRLRLADGASLILYGDLRGIGTPERPITVRGATSDEGWGALVVQGRRTAPRTVHLEHTTLVGGSGAENARSHFTGALSVTDGIVTLRNSSFLDAAADDGINLKYSRVELESNLFRGSRDDAVDLDFCTGTVVADRFLDPGGDGLDLSGSEVRVERIFVEGCGDKGISVGERTAAEISDALIVDCSTGIASKDESTADIRHSGLAHLDVGIALYRKKLAFGAPSATVEAVAFAEVATPFLERPDSHLELLSAARYSADLERESEWPGLTRISLDRPPSRRELIERVLKRTDESRPYGVRVMPASGEPSTAHASAQGN